MWITKNYIWRQYELNHDHGAIFWGTWLELQQITGDNMSGSWRRIKRRSSYEPVARQQVDHVPSVHDEHS